MAAKISLVVLFVVGATKGSVALTLQVAKLGGRRTSLLSLKKQQPIETRLYSFVNLFTSSTEDEKEAVNENTEQRISLFLDDQEIDFLSTPAPTQKKNRFRQLSQDSKQQQQQQQQQQKKQKKQDYYDDDYIYDEEFLMLKPKTLSHERDYFRQDTRVAAWDSYVLVSVLSTSISYNALQSFAINPEHEGMMVYEALKLVVQTVAGFAVLSGLYATMVFSLSILYGKSALGLERDPQYDNFMKETGDIRYTAFRAFSLSLSLFATLVILVLSEDLPSVLHLPIGSVLLGMLYFGYRDYKKLVDSATPIYRDD